MPLKVEVHNAFTGAHVADVTRVMDDTAPTRRLGGSGTASFNVKLAELEALGVDKATARNELFPRRARFITVHDGTSVPYTGLIMKRKPSPDGSTLTLDTAEVRIAASWRMTAGVNQVQNGDLFATDVSATHALRLILQRMLNGDATWQMPIDWASLATGVGDIDLDAPWYNTVQIEDLIQELEDQGYEVDFEPTRTSSGALVIVPRIAPVITSGQTDFSTGAVRSAIADLIPVEDSTVQFTGVLGAGSGSGSDTKFAWAGNSGSTGIPIADVRRDFGDIFNTAALQRATNAELAKYANGVEQWSFSINLDDAGLGYEHVAIGRQVLLDVRDHAWIPDGQYTKRVIETRPKLSGGIVGVEVQ